MFSNGNSFSNGQSMNGNSTFNGESRNTEPFYYGYLCTIQRGAFI